MKRPWRKVILVLFVLVALGVVFIGTKFRDRYYQIWFPAYISQVLSSPPDKAEQSGPLHIMVSIIDHFEPGKDYKYLQHWIDSYRGVVSRHQDSYGVPPQHTFAYPIEQFDSTELEMLLPLCQAGYGEIEVHLHHFNDDSASVTQKYKTGLEKLATFGICQTVQNPPQTRFVFVHGNWALDNSQPTRVPNPCGVNDEIKILASLGCYMDATFPAIQTTSQPSKINSIYYATDDPEKPKSYDEGVSVEVGKAPSGDLMLYEGPLMVDWTDWRFGYHPTIEDGDMFRDLPPSPDRIPLWLDANVHVIGQPNWVFVKLHCHGAHKADSLAMWGPAFDSTLTAFETKYNDGEKYVLHYVTLREAYNVIKAAEAGEKGDPENYRDYVIPPYRATASIAKPQEKEAAAF